MLVVVVIIFMLSWLPLYAIFIRIKLGSEQMDAAEAVLLAYATPVAQWLGASNSCINPVLYAYFNQKYRRGFTSIIQSGSCCGTIRTTAADYEQRYVTTSEINIAGSFARSRRGASTRRSTPTFFAAANQQHQQNHNHHQHQLTGCGPSTTTENGSNSARNNSKAVTTYNRRDDHECGRHHEQLRSKLNGPVVNTQDSIELNAIHRKWKSQVI